eukprot:c9196_g1_i1.p1 GENE.c9196_g1_i1~~c9196_g1_i1.p1  ORF type:complete len:162 (-),score=39.26 c9196_g1_i1:26-511(-)
MGMDADDEMHKQRIEIVYDVIRETSARCVLHGYTSLNRDSESSFNWHEAYVLRGSKIYEHIVKVEGTATVQVQKLGLLITSKYNRLGPHHGHPSCLRSVFNQVKYSDDERGQDCMFVRSVLNRFGASDSTMVYVDLPLSTYHPSDHVDNEQRKLKIKPAAA